MSGQKLRNFYNLLKSKKTSNFSSGTTHATAPGKEAPAGENIRIIYHRGAKTNKIASQVNAAEHDWWIN